MIKKTILIIIIAIYLNLTFIFTVYANDGICQAVHEKMRLNAYEMSQLAVKLDVLVDRGASARELLRINNKTGQVGEILMWYDANSYKYKDCPTAGDDKRLFIETFNTYKAVALRLKALR